MRDIPIGATLNFPAPNYKNPHTRGNALVIVNAVFISLVVVVVLLRIYTRIAIKRWFGSDDVFITFALITTIGLTISVILAHTRYCWDRHVWDIPLHTVPNTSKIALVAKLLFIFAATFTRISLLCFYYRLVRNSGIRWFNYAIHASLIFTIAICITFVCLALFLCHPVRAYWTYPPLPNATCLPEGPVTLAAGVTNCIADLLVTVLPIPVVARLQMPVRRRVGVVVLLSLGFIVTVAGVVRTYFIWKSSINSYDETWFAYPLWIAAAVEIDLGVICVSAPALPPLFRQPLIPASLSSFSSKFGSIFHSSRPSHASRRASNLSSKAYRRFSSELHVPPGALKIVRTRSFEMSEWERREAGESGSQEAIVCLGEGQGVHGVGIRGDERWERDERRKREREVERGWEVPSSITTVIQSQSQAKGGK